jgi:hypothetical protein
MVWLRAWKPRDYVLVQQADFEEYLEDVINPLTDVSDVRRLVSEVWQRCIVLT